MLANRVILRSLLKNKIPTVSAVNQYSTERDVFGTREWVGYGLHGSKHYTDRYDFPMPAIRYKEIKGELVGLKEKEKGDWRKLTLDEKKALYRASFCQTFSEVQAPTGEWKYVTGWTLLGISAGIILFMIIKLNVGPPLPESMSEENRAKQLRAILDLKIGGASGTSSKWDYEKDDWKK